MTESASFAKNRFGGGNRRKNGSATIQIAEPFIRHISLRPSRARRSVTSSAYSSWLPTGTP